MSGALGRRSRVPHAAPPCLQPPCVSRRRPRCAALADAVTTLCDRLAAMDAPTLSATKRFQNELDGTFDADVFARSLAASLATADSEEFRARIEAVMMMKRTSGA